MQLTFPTFWKLCVAGFFYRQSFRLKITPEGELKQTPRGHEENIRMTKYRWKFSVDLCLCLRCHPLAVHGFWKINYADTGACTFSDPVKWTTARSGLDSRYAGAAFLARKFTSVRCFFVNVSQIASFDDLCTFLTVVISCYFATTWLGKSNLSFFRTCDHTSPLHLYISAWWRVIHF